MKAKHRLVTITWRDAYGAADNSVFKVGSDHAPVIVSTVGWLLCKDRNGVALANERLEDGQFRGQSFIPADMVQRIKTIRTKEAV